MAYEKQIKHILSGGLNLVSPADTIDETEAQELTNFSFDSFGKLRSRKGHTTLYNLSASVVAMLKTLGARWVAAGGVLYKDGVSVITGLSTDQVSLVGWQSFIWAMSVAGQRKSDGTHNWRWIPQAPATKATTAVATPTETTVVAFSSGFTLDPSGDESYSGGFLVLNPQQDTTYTAVKSIATLDLGTGFSLDDVFRVRVFAHNWGRINAITWQIDVNDGTFQKDYYTATMKQSDINGGIRDDVTIYLRKRPQQVDIAATDKKLYGWFDRIGQTPGKDYSTCNSVRIKIEFNDTTKVRFEEWVLVGNEDATIEGDDIVWYYTNQTDAGHESNPSPISDPPITLNRGAGALSALAVSGDAQVTHKNIYRGGGTLGAVFLVAINTVTNAATTYTDVNSDDDLENIGTELENDHDDPPTVGGLFGPYFGRLIAFGLNKYYWSHTDKPYAFNGPALAEGDFEPVDEGVGNLLAATYRPGWALFYGQNGVVMLQGDPGDLNSASHTTAIDMGIKSPRGVCQTPKGDFANMSEGVYAVVADSTSLISQKIDPVFKGEDGFTAFDPTKACVGHRNNVVWVSDGTYTFKFDLLTGRWFQDSRLFTCFYSDGDVLLGGTASGDVLELETTAQDNGSGIAVAYTTKNFDMGIVDNPKTWEDFTCWANTQNQNLTVQALMNHGASDAFTVSLGTINSSANIEKRFVMQFNTTLATIPTGDAAAIKARTCAIRITGTVSSEVSITKMALNYYVEARDAKSFDSDEMDFGTHKTKEILEIYVDLQSPATAQLIIQTDQPGFEMATRDSGHSFAISNTRRGDEYVLGTSALAHNARFLLNGVDFRLYGMRVLLQVIGTLLAGSKGEFYFSDPIDLGIELVKLDKEIELVYASDDTAQLHIYTELPGGTLVDVQNSPFTIPSTSGVRTVNLQTMKIRLTSLTKGRFIAARIVPVGNFRLEALRFFYKVIGSPSATPWSWAPFPVEATQPAIWKEVPIQMDVPA